MKNRLIIAVVILAVWNSLCAQENDKYRLQALKFFCSNKYDIFGLNNTTLGDFEPVFVIDLVTNDSSESYYIGNGSFDPDTSFVDNFLHKSMAENIIIKEEDLSVSSPLVLSEFCDCLYQCVYLEDCYELIGSISCRREFGLSVSQVIPYNGKNYVALRISSYFESKVDKLQYCLMEFSKEGNIPRCFVGRYWWVD